MVQKYIYVRAVVTFCAVLGCGFLIATFLKILLKDCDLDEPVCIKGKILKPADAVLYKPFWISLDPENKTENNTPFSYVEDAVLKTVSQAETILLDCQTDEPFWWTPEMILQHFLQMQNKQKETNEYLTLPKFWIRLAISGNPGEQNTSACVELINYALTNLRFSFQGILIEADQLLNFSARIDEKKESSKVWTKTESRTINFWKRFGIPNIGLLMDSNSCFDIFERVPKTVLQKFNQFFFLDDFAMVGTAGERTRFSDSLGYENCTINIKDELNLQYVISDKANVFGNSYLPICIIDE